MKPRPAYHLFTYGMIVGAAVTAALILFTTPTPPLAIDRDGLAAARDIGRQCRQMALIDTCFEVCFRTYPARGPRDACVMGVLYPATEDAE